jgi:hypothetical protein
MKFLDEFKMKINVMILSCSLKEDEIKEVYVLLKSCQFINIKAFYFNKNQYLSINFYATISQKVQTI